MSFYLLQSPLPMTQVCQQSAPMPQQLLGTLSSIKRIKKVSGLGKEGEFQSRGLRVTQKTHNLYFVLYPVDLKSKHELQTHLQCFNLGPRKHEEEENKFPNFLWGLLKANKGLEEDCNLSLKMDFTGENR